MLDARCRIFDSPSAIDRLFSRTKNNDAAVCEVFAVRLEELMGAEREPDTDFTIYLLTTPAGRDAFIAL